MKTPTNTKTFGDWAEHYALHYLQQQGLHLICQNFHSRYGEIDLILVQDTCLIFVEVKARTSTYYGSACEMLTPTKQRKIIQTAYHFLTQHPEYEHYDCRFDLIAIQKNNKQPLQSQQPLTKHMQSPNFHLEWIKNAFQILE